MNYSNFPPSNYYTIFDLVFFRFTETEHKQKMMYSFIPYKKNNGTYNW